MELLSGVGITYETPPPPPPPQLQKEESARNEAEAKLATVSEQMEESEKKYETQIIEKDSEIRQLKEEVSYWL